MRKTVYVILVLCCFIIKAYSINRPYYHFKQLSIKEGLPTSIISLYDDKNGSLWVGTTQGIYRFNGEKIKKYNLPYLLRKNSHHVIYLYNKVRQPWKTQKYAAQVMHDLYFNAPAGLCGNEDCGQMSAWYVFSAMGFYPVNPVSGEYEIGTPLFSEIQMHLDNGKTFTVLAPGVSRENIYIQSVKVNGQPYDKSYITHRQIMDGATVEFEMGPEPGNIWYR